MGDVDGAWKTASEYYLKGVETPFGTVKFMTNIYIGHGSALCEIVQKPECRANLDKLVYYNSRISSEVRVRPWAYQITKVMYERSGAKN